MADPVRYSSRLCSLCAMAVLSSLLVSPTGAALGAARPAKTEDSPLVPRGAVRIAMGYEIMENGTGLEAKAGVASVTVGLTPDADLTMEGAYLHLAPPDGPEAEGGGDPLVSVRVRLMNEAARRPGVDLSIAVKLPSGDHARGLGTEETDFLTFFHFYKRLGLVRTHLNLGLTVVGLVDSPHEQEDSFVHGVVFELPLARRASILLDLHGEHLTNIRRNPFSVLVDHDEAVLLGLRLPWGKNTWDVGYLRTFTGGSPGWGLTGGITRQIRIGSGADARR